QRRLILAIGSVFIHQHHFYTKVWAVFFFLLSFFLGTLGFKVWECDVLKALLTKFSQVEWNTNLGRIAS
ncbi:hypothetical protein B0T09DRAFT_412844, partial [Sordaria sp. MPI-SDFR-AT-0083]